MPELRRYRVSGFSLIEVVIALGIVVFVLVALVGLFVVGLDSSRHSEQQLQAANLASVLVQSRIASPTNSFTNFAIPASAMTNAYGNAYSTAANFVSADGQLTSAEAAAYAITCRAGTNAFSGSDTAQLYLRLTWPPQADPDNASGYEILTYVPLR